MPCNHYPSNVCSDIHAANRERLASTLYASLTSASRNAFTFLTNASFIFVTSGVNTHSLCANRHTHISANSDPTRIRIPTHHAVNISFIYRNRWCPNQDYMNPRLVGTEPSVYTVTQPYIIICLLPGSNTSYYRNRWCPNQDTS